MRQENVWQTIGQLCECTADVTTDIVITVACKLHQASQNCIDIFAASVCDGLVDENVDSSESS